MKSVMITGVSSGIGHQSLHTFLKDGWKVYGSVRKDSDVERLLKEISSDGYTGIFHPILLDVTDHDSIHAAALEVDKDLSGATLSCLINNAGMNCGPDPMELIPPEKLRYQFEVNVIGPTVVTQAFLPMLGTDANRTGPPGMILFVGSIYGHFGIPWQGPYCATKHALEGLSESLRQELMIFGINVTIIRPGPVDSAIWDKSNAPDRTKDAGTGDWEAYENSAYADALAGTRAYITEDMTKSDFYLPCSTIADIMLKVASSSDPPASVVKTSRILENWILPRWAPVKQRDRVITAKVGIKQAALDWSQRSKSI